MSKKTMLIALACLVAVGSIVTIIHYQHREPPDQDGLLNSGNDVTPEPEPPEVVTVVQLISGLIVDEYETTMLGREPTIGEGTAVRVLGRVEDFRVVGEHPDLRGEVDLKPYHCSKWVQCILDGEAVAFSRDIDVGMDVIIEGVYGGVKRFPFTHDVCLVVDCSSLLIETPQVWTVPVAEEMIGDAMRGERLAHTQSGFRKGDIVRVYGPIYSNRIEWGYIEGMWGEVFVSRRAGFGTVCRFEDEQLRAIMELPEGQEVIVEGSYSHGSTSLAFLTDCVLIYP